MKQVVRFTISTSTSPVAYWTGIDKFQSMMLHMTILFIIHNPYDDTIINSQILSGSKFSIKNLNYENTLKIVIPAFRVTFTST